MHLGLTFSPSALEQQDGKNFQKKKTDQEHSIRMSEMEDNRAEEMLSRTKAPNNCNKKSKSARRTPFKTNPKQVHPARCSAIRRSGHPRRTQT